MLRQLKRVLSRTKPIKMVKRKLPFEGVVSPEPPPQEPDTPTVPNAPTGFMESVVEFDRITFNWNNMTNISGFRLRRSGTLVYQGTNTSFTNTGLQSMTTYEYSLTAYNEVGESPPVTRSVTTAQRDIIFPGDGTNQ